ncbi:type II CAAX endopeptidase family protein [Streptococcus sp. Marseille-Q0941]|uniref:CPBP family intramembrane glutamic endopeptidase n=1 Tax=Streptococcus sp. Marseille-Q0941 TaxID=2942206 RepID=UPI00207394D5|nr:type II CAAX endopeptidase family protein [Streptococcus sp. Marseille-Q0941]
MKKLGHLGIYTLMVFLSIYLLDFSSLYLAKMFVWGMDGYSIIVAVEQLALLGLLIYWLKKKKMLYIFEKKGSEKSRFFYLVVSLAATYVVRQLLSAFYLQFSRFINNHYIFEDLLSVISISGESTILMTCFSFVSVVILGPLLEEIVHRGYFMNTFFPKSKYYLDVILSALIFGLSHLVLSHRDPISLMVYSFSGLFFALVYRWTKNLKITILCHSFMNFLIHADFIWLLLSNLIYDRFFR